MKRRHLLGLATSGLAALVAGCLDSPRADTTESPTPSPTPNDPVEHDDVEATFTLDVDFGVDRFMPEDPPEVTVENETEVTVEGTIEYGSSTCGTGELAHIGYEQSQSRLDVLVVAADDTESNDEDGDTPTPCTADLIRTGYRVEASVDGSLRRVSATEHHELAGSVTTTKDLTDW